MSTAPAALIHDLTRARLVAECSALGEPSYRADQLWKWLYVSKARDWEAMRNLPRDLLSKLGERFAIAPAGFEAAEGEPGGTRKLLLRLRDEARIESVIIPSGKGWTLCVSSQVGCRYRCAFCASGQDGLERNLSPGEIVGQVLEADSLMGGRPSNLVYMGVGEPMDNYEAVLESVRILNDPDGFAIGARRITISTCGIVPGIMRLAKEQLQVELSVSLHAPNHDLRVKLMPVERLHPLRELIAACRDYNRRTGRIITFEYALIRGLNDSEPHAGELANLLSGFGARVNLIPLSEVGEFDGRPTPPEGIRAFALALERRGLNVTVRASKGSRLRAACGQLRASRAVDGRPA
ncbi:MAG: 23S rRNA (adenine(2503)-C(2))-methyltransferase RlmN [Lentisphaerae bacterium]|nr:23S rRNA (adenine(2503)-C(2))-methyltransferase RlmN [Lentisphaerota bacterium]